MVFLLAGIAFGRPSPCETMRRQIWNTPLSPKSYSVQKNTEKQERDTYQLPNNIRSENFILHWGNDLSLSEQKQTAILDHLEASWEYEVEQQGYPEPYGADSYLFNIYMGDSGNGAPSSSGVAGYYSTDADGWPMIVLGQYVSEHDDQYSVIPHEFFHAVQHSTDSYSYSGDSAWYWEATATWMENQVLPEDPNYAAFLFGYAFLPHHSLLFFDYYDTGSVEEYHQYGAFIFPQFLTDYYDASDWIRDSWVSSDGYSEPFGYLIQRMTDDGYDPSDLFAEFAASNVYWDYPHQSWYLYYLDYYASYFNTKDHRIAADIHSNGTGGWLDSPSDFPLEYAGYHHIQMSEPSNDTLYLSLEGEQYGSEGSVADWSLMVVRKSGDTISYESIDLDNPTEYVALNDLLMVDELTLSISVLADEYIEGEHFGYQYRLVSDVTIDSESGKHIAEGCSCSAKPLKPWSSLLMMLCFVGITTVRRR